VSAAPGPLVSVVTPSYNQGAFIRATIESVLAQDYPSIEYLVVDGGSTDGTQATLRGYGERVRWVSEPDRGQADALNKSFRLTSGAILGWLNSDDVYLPGAVRAAVETLADQPDLALVYGDAQYIGPDGRRLGAYPTEPFDLRRLAQTCFICQPAGFFRREALEAVGGLDASLHYAMDYDLWFRLASRFRVAHVARELAQSRQHPEAKSVARRHRQALFREIYLVLRRHVGRVPLRWRWCRAHHAVLDRLSPGARLLYRTSVRRLRPVIEGRPHG